MLTRRGLFALTASAAAARKLPVVVAPPVDAYDAAWCRLSEAWVTVGVGGNCLTLREAQSRVRAGGVIYIMPSHRETLG